MTLGRDASGNPRERRVRYTSKDGIALQRRFGRSVAVLIQECLVGQSDDGVDTKLYDREVQIAVLHLGLAHDMPKVLEDQVVEWVDAELIAGRTIRDVVWPAYKAAMYAGLLGRSIDVDEVYQKVMAGLAEAKGEAPPASGGQEGNAEAPGPSET